MSRTYVLTLGVALGIGLALYADVDGGAAWAASVLIGVMAAVLLKGAIVLITWIVRRGKDPSHDPRGPGSG